MRSGNAPARIMTSSLDRMTASAAAFFTGSVAAMKRAISSSRRFNAAFAPSSSDVKCLTCSCSSAENPELVRILVILSTSAAGARYLESRKVGWQVQIHKGQAVILDIQKIDFLCSSQTWGEPSADKTTLWRHCQAGTHLKLPTLLLDQGHLFSQSLHVTLMFHLVPGALLLHLLELIMLNV
jgi:hypothetical protein